MHGPQVAQHGPRSALERIDSLEKNVCDHEQRFGLSIEQVAHDVRHIARVLGVTLPSDEQKLTEDRRYTGGEVLP